MNTIKLGDHTYQVSKLNAMKQFHVLRRLAPIMATLGMNFGAIQKMSGPEQMAELLQPFAEMLSRMSDAEADYIIMTSLSVVAKEQNGQRAPLVTGDPPQLMFQDLEMQDMIRLVVEVIKVNFSGFFGELGGMIGSPSS